MWTAVAGYFIAFFAEDILDQKYLSYPRHPDPATFRTVPHQDKGLVYITREQSEMLHWLGWAEAMFLALIAISKIIDEKWPLPSQAEKDGAPIENFAFKEAEFAKKQRMFAALVAVMVIMAIIKLGTIIVPHSTSESPAPAQLPASATGSDKQ